MFDIPEFRLRDKNIFNYRDRQWNDDLIEKIARMLSCGEQYGLRVNSISIDNPEKIDYFELCQTTYKVLNIKLTAADNDIDLSYDIPWLMDNHFFIGGNYKVPIFQLFDKPLIVRSNMIKLRTNIYSFMLSKGNTSRRRAYHYVLSMMGKKVPFAKVVLAFYKYDRAREVFELNASNEYIGTRQLSEDSMDLLSDVQLILNDQTITEDRLLGSEFPRKSDTDIINDLKLITEIDIFSKDFMTKDNIVEELLYAINNERFDDTDYTNKRIRFTEYVIFIHLCKDFYNLLATVRRNRRVKFSNNSKIILSNVNQSSITQFDFSLNPLAELALLSRTSLSGPGGFEKTNVPAYLRDLHPSMKGLIGPADTADRDGCGTIQYLTPVMNIEGNGTINTINDKVLNSISINHVPFLEHDDPTRLQMSSSQQRHSIMLKEFDMPLVQSGIEGMYTDQTSFMFKAKRNGKVIYSNYDIIIVQYDNKACEAFNIGYRKLYLSIADFYNVYFTPGQDFKRGDIIAESNYLKNGRLTIGKNLLTAIMVWYGYNYEDGIIVSEKIVDDDKYTSVHYMDLTFELPPNKILENLNSDYSDYKPLPEVLDRLHKGDVYGKIRTIFSEGFNDVIFEPVNELTIPEDCIITDIKIYANKWDKSFPQYDNYIKQLIENQKTKKTEIISMLSQHLTKDELEKFLSTLEFSKSEKNRNNYKVKGDSVDGVRIEITAMYERKLTVGDKLGNRHGNKGIIAAIVPDDKMPRMPDGRRAEIIINPLGIPSRMNIGQLFETHLAMSVMDLKRTIRSKYERGESQEDIYNYIIEYIKIIDKTDDDFLTSQIQEYLRKTSIVKFMEELNDFFVIQPPFQSIQLEDLKEALRYTGTEYEYPCFDPISNKNTENEVAFGYQYFMKLNHIAKDKMSYRGVGPYSTKTAQPLAGKSRKGGQRLGEMEIWAIIAHSAEKNLKEFLTTKSDSIKKRNEYISEMMCNDTVLLDSEDDGVSQSLRLLQNNLRSIGLDYELNENEVPQLGENNEE